MEIKPRTEPHSAVDQALRNAFAITLLFLQATCTHSALAKESGRGDGLAVPYRFGDVERWAPVFENPQRDSYQMPERILASLDLAPGTVIADVGAATGYFARRFARAVGEQGIVYAVDIEPAPLRWLEERAKQDGIHNIRTVLATATDSNLPVQCCDVIFLSNTYHMLAPRIDYLQHLQSRLKPEGRIVIIDWRKQSLPRGPEPRWKLTARQVAEEAVAAGLCIVDRPQYLPYHYFFILRPCARH